MYINYKLLYSKGLKDRDFHTLQKIFQKEELLLEQFKDDFKALEELGLIQYLKGKENTAKGVRISRKGKDFMSQLETNGYTDEIGELLNKIIESYLTNDKPVGNKLEVKSRLLWFIGQTGFSSKVISTCVESYLFDNPQYTKSLENLLWSPPSKAFSTHKNLKNSKLFDYICQKYDLNQTFIVENKKGKEINWLGTIATLNIPKKLNSELYFTGSYETDREHMIKLRTSYIKTLKN